MEVLDGSLYRQNVLRKHARCEMIECSKLLLASACNDSMVIFLRTFTILLVVFVRHYVLGGLGHSGRLARQTYQQAYKSNFDVNLRYHRCKPSSLRPGLRNRFAYYCSFFPPLPPRLLKTLDTPNCPDDAMRLLMQRRCDERNAPMTTPLLFQILLSRTESRAAPRENRGWCRRGHIHSRIQLAPPLKI